MGIIILSEKEYKAKLKQDIERLRISIDNLVLCGPQGEIWFNSYKHRNSLLEVLSQWEEDYRLPMFRIY